MLDAKQLAANAGHLAKASPEASSRFVDWHRSAMSDGALSGSNKELMALAISIVKGCEDCCVFHLQQAQKQGASNEEIAEALEVAVLMGGGPAYTYAAQVAAAMS